MKAITCLLLSELLTHLAEIRELVFVIDGSEVGHALYHPDDQLDLWQTRFADHLVGGHEAVKDTCRNTFIWICSPSYRPSCPKTARRSSWAMANLMGSNSRRLCSPWACVMFVALPRTPSSMKMDCSFPFADLLVRPGDQISIPNVCFTRQGYGPVTVIAWWERRLPGTHLSGDQFRTGR